MNIITKIGLFLIIKFPILLGMYHVINPPNNIIINKELKRWLNFLNRYKLSDVYINGMHCYFKSTYGVWFAYVEGWGAYSNEYGIIHEKAEIDFIIEHIPKNGVLIDVGANYGVFSLNIMSKREDIRVHAFEPVKNTYNFLIKNITANHFGNRITPYNMAVGENEGKAYIESNRHTNNQIVGKINGLYSNKNIEEVVVTTIDVITKSGQFNSIDFIKVDVEGFEPFVLNGASSTIEQYRPLLLLEIYDPHLVKFEYDKNQVIGLLEKMNYLLIKPEKWATNNYLFVPKEKRLNFT